MGASALEIVRGMMAQKAGKADIGSVLDELWEQFHGATGIAQEVKDLYDDKRSSPNAKLNMLRALIEQMGQMQERKDKNGKGEPQTEVSPHELAAALQYFQETQNGQNPPSGLRQAAESGGDQPGAPAERSGDDSEKYQG